MSRDGGRNDNLTLVWPGFRRAAMLAWRVARLRCPYCGRGHVVKRWLFVQDQCPYCHRLLQRGESDYFIGGMMFNVLLSEALFVVILAITLLLLPPPTPWEQLEFWIPVGMVGAPFLMYPFSKLAWLAFDLLFRPDAARE